MEISISRRSQRYLLLLPALLKYSFSPLPQTPDLSFSALYCRLLFATAAVLPALSHLFVILPIPSLQYNHRMPALISELKRLVIQIRIRLCIVIVISREVISNPVCSFCIFLFIFYLPLFISFHIIRVIYSYPLSCYTIV